MHTIMDNIYIICYIYVYIPALMCAYVIYSLAARRAAGGRRHYHKMMMRCCNHLCSCVTCWIRLRGARPHRWWTPGAAATGGGVQQQENRRGVFGEQQHEQRERDCSTINMDEIFRCFFFFSFLQTDTPYFFYNLYNSPFSSLTRYQNHKLTHSLDSLRLPSGCHVIICLIVHIINY